MIKRIKLELGNGLYVSAGNNLFHKLFYEHLIDEFEPIFKCPIQGEPLIDTVFDLKVGIIDDLSTTIGR